MVVCDINDLKLINDTIGHKAGDDYIRNASKLLCDTFVHSPVFRIGGDEFVAILKGSDFANREELFTDFNNMIDENNMNGGVVISGGMAVFDPEIDESYNDAFKRADELMYVRKNCLKAAKK